MDSDEVSWHHQALPPVRLGGELTDITQIVARGTSSVPVRFQFESGLVGPVVVDASSDKHSTGRGLCRVGRVLGAWGPLR